ncbi:hypothetical protein Tco_1278574 [Tanacetum coccineum]
MHTSKDDYLINTLRFISANEESQLNGAQLSESMTSSEMRETKAYKTYLGYATRLKRVKRPAKKSTNAQTVGVIIRDNLVMSLSKKKEKAIVEKRKGIDLLSKVALTKKAQYEEVHKKRTSAKPGVPDVTEEESTKSEAESWGRDEDDSNNDHDQLVKAVIKRVIVVMIIPNLIKKKGRIPSMKLMRMKIKRRMKKRLKMMKKKRRTKSKVEDKAEGNEDKGMDYTTNQFDDDVDVRLNKPVNTDKGFIQKEGTDAEMINV